MKRYHLHTLIKFCVLTILVFQLKLGKALSADCSYLVWSDEFNAAGAPAANHWDYDTGGGGWGNNELQTYTNTRTNSWVANGKLYIKAIKANNNWTSARLVTRQKGDWLYGRIEVKAKLPSGKGTWPAIWMLPTDWVYGSWPSSGELDIMEHVGYDPGQIYGTAHTEAYNHSLGTQKGGNIYVADAMTAFHVYAIEWDAEQIRWYVDDQLYFTFNNEHKTYKEWPFDKRFHLLLNIAIGGDWGGAQGIDPNLNEATMEVDYVRVYSNDLPRPVISGPSMNSANDQATYSVNPINGAKYLWHFPDGVEVVSGGTTSSATVRWNDVPGDIQVELQTACDTAISNSFHVDLQSKPTTDRLDIFPLNDAQEMQWTVVPGDNNSMDLSEDNQALVVNFQINNPSANAYLQYDFSGLVDLTSNYELAFELQIDPDNPPSNMRIDLIDVNGNVKLSNLFKIDQFENDNLYHLYSHQFTKSTDGSFYLDQIKSIRIYVNYGIFGQVGSGTFKINDMRLQNPDATAVAQLKIDQPFSVYPNPANDWITIQSSERIHSIQLFSLSGQLIQTKSIAPVNQYQFSVSHLNSGYYFLKVNGTSAGMLSVY